MKKAAIYVRVSTPDQHVESQLYDLRELAAQKGYEIVHEYEDRGISGTKARRPGLDALMADARRKKFSVLLVTGFDRIARSTRNFLQIIDELDSMGIEFISRREGVANGDAMGRLFVTIISAISELERSLIVERVKSGMRRAKLEGRQIGRARLDIDREQVVTDRRTGMSLTLVARKHSVSRATVCRLMKESKGNSAAAVVASDGNLMARVQAVVQFEDCLGCKPVGRGLGGTMKPIGFYVCLGTVALLGTTGMARSSKAAFSVTAAAAYSEVKIGEDVYVKVTLTNNSNRVVTLEFATPLCDYSMEVRDSAGNLAPDTEVKSKTTCPPDSTGAHGFVPVKPNESYTGTISVSMFSDMSRSGEYSVQVVWREPKELGGVLLKSNTVKITVVP